jgi:hypothetical protein
MNINPDPITPSPAKQTNPWVIVAIVVGVLALLICCFVAVFFLLPVMLVLFGPAVGSVFSNITNSLTTPMP